MQCSDDTSRLGFLTGVAGMALLGVSCGATLDLGPQEPRLIVVRQEVVQGHAQRFIEVPTERWTLVGSDGDLFEFEGRSIGRAGYSIDVLPEGCPYTELGVVTFDFGGPARTLSFVFHGPDEDHGVAVYELWPDGHYHLLARTHPGVHAYDWAVFAHDRKTLAVWGDGLDQYERDGEWFVHTSSVRGGWFKAFPVVSEQGRVAARLIRPEPYAEAVVVDGVVSDEWHRVRAPVFSADGAHVAYLARQDGEWFLVVDGLAYGPTGDFHLDAFGESSHPVMFTTTGATPGRFEYLQVLDPKLTPGREYDTLEPRMDLPQGPFVPIP